MLFRQLQELVHQCIRLKNLHLLEQALALYIEYTSHTSNKAFFQTFLDGIGANGEEFIRVHYQYFKMIDNLVAGRNPFVQSMHQDTEKLIGFLEQQPLSVHQDVFYNKTVVKADIKGDVYHFDNLSVTNASLPFFVFVDQVDLSYPSLPIIYTHDKLYLKNTAYARTVHSELVAQLENCYFKATGGLLRADAPPLVGLLAIEMVYRWLTFWYQNKYMLTNVKYTLCSGESKVIERASAFKTIYYFLFDLFWLFRVASVPKVIKYMYGVFDLFAAYASSPVQSVYGVYQEEQFTLEDLGFSLGYSLLFSVPENRQLFLQVLSQLADQGYVVEWGWALLCIHHQKHYQSWNVVNSWSYFHPVYFLFFVEQGRLTLPLEGPQPNVVVFSLFVKYLIQEHRVKVDVLLEIICLLDCVFMSEAEPVLFQDLFQGRCDRLQFDRFYAFIQNFQARERETKTTTSLLYRWLCGETGVEAVQVRHRLMASASVQLEVGTRPVVHIELPRLLMHEVYSTFSQSQLVHYVVTHDVDPSNAVLFQDVEAWEPSELEEFRLPVTEIAVNEGSTKAFENSVVTETIQNSLDAIRSHAHVRAEVRCEVGEDEQFYIYKISDFVGMSPENLLSLMIPFLSSKEVGGQLTTGEMGSGFFNVYRESELVFIDSTLHGRRTLIVDEPVVEHGRVVDLVRRVQVLHIEDSGRRQTDIYVCISKGFQLSGFSMFIKNVLCFIPDVPIYLNNELIHVPTVPLLETELFLATHIGKPDMQSYVLTKGVPFSPLYEFIKTSGLFQFPSSEYLASEFQTGILVQLKHNVFTPVQTRARISLLPEVVKPLKQFLLDALYVSLLTKISEGSILNVNYYLPNFTSPLHWCNCYPAGPRKCF